MSVSRVYVHKDFDKSRSFDNDIAVLKLNDEITFDHKVRPICLPGKHDKLYGQAVTIGWGHDNRTYIIWFSYCIAVLSAVNV